MAFTRQLMPVNREEKVTHDKEDSLHYPAGDFVFCRFDHKQRARLVAGVSPVSLREVAREETVSLYSVGL
jgi:hypothetical protein